MPNNSFFFLLVCFVFLACKDNDVSVVDNFQMLDVPEVYVRNDDPLIQFRDSTYLYGTQPFSGYLINSFDQVNKLQYGYVNGIQEGLQKGWHTDSKLSFEYYCHNGKRVGEYKEYYPNGKLQIVAVYKMGKEVKKKILDINGKVIANYTLKNGRYYGLLGSSNCMTLIED